MRTSKTGMTVGFVFCVLALGQTPGDPNAQTPPDTQKPASLEGTVHAASGEPLSRVHVTLRGVVNGQQRLFGAMTAPDGKFSLTGIPAGNYNSAVEKVGYVVEAAPAARYSVRLKAEEKRSDFKLTMIPTGAIVGRITNSDGEPMEGVTVTAEGNAGTEFGASDEKGLYRIGGLAPGKYLVAATQNLAFQMPPEIRTDGTVDVHNARTWYPGVLSPKEAARVQVRSAGEASGVDIQMARVPWVRVSGSVVGRARSTDQAFLMVQELQQESVSGVMPGNQVGAIVKPDGTFETWRLDPGKYKLTARLNGNGGQALQSGSVEIEVAGANIGNLALRFIANFDLGGRLEYETEAAKKMPQQTRQPQPVRTIYLREPGMNVINARPVQVTDDDTFVFTKVPPGKYQAGLSWNTAYVRALRLGSTLIEGNVVDLNNAGDGAQLTLVLGSAGGSISGTVQDDSGNAQGTRIALLTEDPALGFQPRYATASADGSYSFPNLPPGRYKVVAVAEADSDSIAQRFGLDGYEDLMETVALGEDEKVTRDLKRRSPANR